MVFIKLTSDGGQPVFINFNNVLHIREDVATGNTTIAMVSEVINVKETPAEIMRLTGHM